MLYAADLSPALLLHRLECGEKVAYSTVADMTVWHQLDPKNHNDGFNLLSQWNLEIILFLKRLLKVPRFIKGVD